MCKNIKVMELTRADQVYNAYLEAVNSDKSYIIIEHSDLYNLDVKEDIKRSKEK